MLSTVFSRSFILLNKMKNKFGKYTKERVSNIPFDTNDHFYKEFREKIPQFIGQAVYIYSFEQNRILFAQTVSWANSYKLTESFIKSRYLKFFLLHKSITALSQYLQTSYSMFSILL